eukprot:COSAG01_NODE_27040_length_696_cov_1.115578_2_plen_104_part_00
MTMLILLCGGSGTARCEWAGGGHRGSGSSALGKAQLWEERQLAMLSYLQQHTTVNLAGVDTLSVLFDEYGLRDAIVTIRTTLGELAENCLYVLRCRCRYSRLG